MTLIETRNLGKSYPVGDGLFEVLKNINLVVSDCEFCGVVGPSGSGKTTLLYVLSGLEKATLGEVVLFGKRIQDYSIPEMQSCRRNDIAFIFQFYNLLPNLNVRENLEVAMAIGDGINSTRITELLEKVGMAQFGDFFPNQLSGGMQQRVAIARALVGHPRILFADEPTGNLDQQSGKEIMDLLKKIQQEEKITVMMVTHNRDYLAYCDRQISLLDGVVQNDEQH